MNIKSLLHAFRPQFVATPLSDIFMSAAAAGIAILVLGWVLRYLPQAAYPLPMLFSIGASATLLFVAPHSPKSHPWALIGGNLVSALVGWGCAALIHDPVLAAGCAVGLAVLLMLILQCLHPPAASTALVLALSALPFHSLGWEWIIRFVAINSTLLLALALLINNLLPGRRYPFRHHHDTPLPDSGLQHADVLWAMEQMRDGVVDVREEDLLDIFRLATAHAERRRS